MSDLTSKKPGFLITLEGGEGGGKTTQITRLSELLTQAGHEVVVLREPGGPPISEQIRELVLSPKNTEIAFTTEVLLFQAQRAQTYHEIVLPALAAGKIVLMDRSRDSSTVYQGMVRGFGVTLIEQLNDISTQNTYPDLTFLLDVDASEGLRRRAASGKQDRIDLENIEFHEKARSSYLTVANENSGGRWAIIDANAEIDTVAREMWQAVREKLNIG